MDTDARQVVRAGGTTELRAKELELLLYLADRAGTVVGRSELLAQVWGYHPDSASRTLDTTVRRLRRAIERDPAQPEHVLTAPGEGYLWAPADDEVDAAERFLRDGVDALLASARGPTVHALWGPPGIGRSTWADRVARAWGCPVVSLAGGPAALASAWGLDPADGLERLPDLIRANPRPGVFDDVPQGMMPLVVASAEAAGRPWLVCVSERPRRPEVVAWNVPPLDEPAAAALFRRVARRAPPPWLPRCLGVPALVELAVGLEDALGVDAEHHLHALLDVPEGDALAATLRGIVLRLTDAERQALRRVLVWPAAAPALLLQQQIGVRHQARLTDVGLLLSDGGGRCHAVAAEALRVVCPPTPLEVSEGWATLGAWLGERILPGSGLLPPDAREALRLCAPLFQQLPVDAPPAVRRAAACHRFQLGVVLPGERDAFVGREEDLWALEERLAGVSLVTLVGFGGAGKTRLARRFGWTSAERYPGGVWFCDLAEARELDDVVGALARGLELRLGPEDPVAQLGQAIAARGRCLVIVDNAEQVTATVGPILSRWLDHASAASFLVTSREVLGLPGERVATLEPLREAEAMALFEARARQVKPDFVVDDPDPLRALVTLLDGLPLAIELAAARSRAMSPAILLSRMSERFVWLASSGGRPDRHATLRGTLDWSWGWLPVDERHTLAELSVFEGGFTLDAAEAVSSLEGARAAAAVLSLVDRSLVRVVADGRFDMLVSVQAYASEQLDALGGRAAAEARHAAWFARTGDPAALTALRTHGGIQLRRALERDRSNLVAACRRAIAAGSASQAVAVLGALWCVVQLVGPFAGMVDLASRVLGMAELSPRDRDRVLHVLAQAWWVLGRMDEARAQFSALVEREDPGDPSRAAEVHFDFGCLCVHVGRYDEACAHLEVARAHNRAVGDPSTEGAALGNLACVPMFEGRFDEARAMLLEALALLRRGGHVRMESYVLINLGEIARIRGEAAEALEHFGASLPLATSLGDRRTAAFLRGNMGMLAHQEGRWEEGLDHLHVALRGARDAGERIHEGHWLGGLGTAYRREERWKEAASCLTEALAIARETGDRRRQGAWLAQLGGMHLTLGELDRARDELDEAESLFRSVDDRLELGKVLCERVAMHARLGDVDVARVALDEVGAIVEGTGVGADSELARAWAGATRCVQPPPP